MAPMLEDNAMRVVTDVTSAVEIRALVPIERPFPHIDDHLVKPEVSRFELIRGREVDVSGAEPPHADAQARLAFLIMAHVVAGFVVSTELLTRVAQGSDFATDVCIRKDGVDPRTDTRYLEDIAFEIVNEQKKRDVADKADDMVCRGVRRAFAIFVKTNQVSEWSAQKRKFIPMDRDAFITDPVFVRPLAVQALLDQAVGEDEAALALIAKRNRAIVQRERDVEERGIKKGRKRGLAEGRKKGLDEGLKKGLDEGRKKGLDEGLKKGLDEGLKKGLDEGLRIGRDLLLGMVQMRNGDVPSHIRQCIETADAHTVMAWGQKLRSGAPVDDVFAISPRSLDVDTHTS